MWKKQQQELQVRLFACFYQEKQKWMNEVFEVDGTLLFYLYIYIWRGVFIEHLWGWRGGRFARKILMDPSPSTDCKRKVHCHGIEKEHFATKAGRSFHMLSLSPPLQLIKLWCVRYVNVAISPFARGPPFVLICFLPDWYLSFSNIITFLYDSEKEYITTWVMLKKTVVFFFKKKKKNKYPVFAIFDREQFLRNSEFSIWMVKIYKVKLHKMSLLDFKIFEI